MAPPTVDEYKNLSFVLHAPGVVSFAERPKPALGDAHDVLVAVNYTGICGSDVHYWRDGAIGPFVVREPMVLGHESAGTVVAVGAAVAHLAPGDRVAIEPGTGCRRCADCRAGRYNLCARMAFAATPPHHGTLTGLWRAPADFCHRLPAAVSLQEGALVEPLAVAVHMVRLAAVRPPQAVAVMGAGPVGLLCAAVARAHGAAVVVSVDVAPARLALARALAATHTYEPRADAAPEESARAIRDLAALPAGPDVVMDATGAEPCIQAGLHLVRRGGTYVQGGMGRPDVAFPVLALCLKEVTAKGSFRYGPGDYELAVELIASGQVDVKKLISAVVPFAEAEDAFGRAARGDVVKVLIAGPNNE